MSPRQPWLRQPSSSGRWLWPREVAEILGVNVQIVTRWSREGRLPHSCTLGGHRRYAKSDILALRDQLTEESTGA